MSVMLNEDDLIYSMWDAYMSVYESKEDKMRDFKQETGGVDGNRDYDKPPKKKSSNKELGIPDFTPEQRAKRYRETMDHIKKHLKSTGHG